MSKNATITKYEGTNKEGRPFKAYKVEAGLYTTLIFPRAGLESSYLDKYISQDAHVDFAGDDLDDLYNKADD